MPEPRAFISFDVDHNSEHKTLFAGQAWHFKTPFSHEDWSAKEPMLQSQWEALVKAKINKTHFMIVLVGRHMAAGKGFRVIFFGKQFTLTLLIFRSKPNHRLPAFANTLGTKSASGDFARQC